MNVMACEREIGGGGRVSTHKVRRVKQRQSIFNEILNNFSKKRRKKNSDVNKALLRWLGAARD